MHNSGDGLDDCYKSTWPYYVSLLFLNKNIAPNSSTGNLDCLLDVKPSLTKKLSDELDTAESQQQDNPSLHDNKIDSNMSVKKGSDIADQLRALLEKSSSNEPQICKKAEQDKLNMAFLETLIPTLREVKKEDMLLCRTDLSRVVFKYAYKDAPWKSLTDSCSSVEKRKIPDEDDGK